MYVKLLLLGCLITGFIAIYYYESLQKLSIFIFSTKNSEKKVKLFTPEELKQYNGVHEPHLYLSIVGKVYNVTKGKKHYGPGNSYHFFTGRDATSAFVTGKMNAQAQYDERDDVLKFNYDEIASLSHWVEFYNSSYNFVGLLMGDFYGNDGELTDYGKQVHKLFKTNRKKKKNKQKYKEKYPPCNIEWDPEKGSRVWCTTRSGGIDRGWVGVPRKFYEPGSTDHRCACIQEHELETNKNIQPYENCEALSVSCFVNN